MRAKERFHHIEIKIFRSILLVSLTEIDIGLVLSPGGNLAPFSGLTCLLADCLGLTALTARLTDPGVEKSAIIYFLDAHTNFFPVQFT